MDAKISTKGLRDAAWSGAEDMAVAFSALSEAYRNLRDAIEKGTYQEIEACEHEAQELTRDYQITGRQVEDALRRASRVLRRMEQEDRSL